MGSVMDTGQREDGAVWALWAAYFIACKSPGALGPE